ncbi:MAG: hypothetical protein KAQ69_02055 [Spirochaetales bacterium]|nr:hypothetical protein [Spirochaetales bacterium]
MGIDAQSFFIQQLQCPGNILRFNGNMEIFAAFLYSLAHIKKMKRARLTGTRKNLDNINLFYFAYFIDMLKRLCAVKMIN